MTLDRSTLLPSTPMSPPTAGPHRRRRTEEAALRRSFFVRGLALLAAAIVYGYVALFGPKH